MTTSTSPASTARPAAASPPPLHRAVGWAAAAGTLPYVALKALWLTGNPAGLTDPAMLADPTLTALNAVTAALDVVVIALALALTHGWGHRLPAWLLLPPMWVGTGFLVPMALVILPATVLSLAAGDTGAGGLDPWVQPMVYGGFAWQGVFLVAACVLHVRARRWEAVTVPAAVSARVMPLLRVVAGGGTVLAVLSAGLHLAVGAAAGGAIAAGVQATSAGLALAGAGGTLALVRGARAHRRLAAAAAWVGSAAMFSWGLWTVVTTVVVAPVGGADPLAGLAQLTGLLGGFALAVAGLLALLGTGVAGRD